MSYNPNAGGTWGAITGTLSSQTDLNTALALKAPLASPTFTGTVGGITATMVGLSNVTNIAQTSVTGLTGTQSVAAFKTGLSLVKADVGLGSVDNTADSAKPVSTAQLTALNLKADLASPTFTGTVTLPAGTVTLAMQANMATASFIGRNTAGTGAPEVLSAATALSILGVTSGASVSSVGGTGTVNGLTLTGTVTGSGSLTLGGTLDLSSPPAIGGTSASTVKGTTITASAAISGSSTTGAYSYGTLAYSDTNLALSTQTSVNSYAQHIIQNTSSGTAASADFVVSNNSGTATTFYGNFGINSSGFTGSGAFNAASAVYVTATSGDLAIGTTTANAIHFVVNGGATDAATISSAGLLTANSFASSSAAITGGTIDSTAIGGSTPAAAKFTTLGWTGVKYTAAGAALGSTIADYFTSSISLDASSVYEIEAVAYFLKTTAGTVTWTWAFSSAPIVSSSFYTETPITGFTTSTITGAPVNGEAHVQAATTMAHAASGSLTTAVYHVFRFKVLVMTNGATTIQLRCTESAGTVTPQAGSFMRASKVL